MSNKERRKKVSKGKEAKKPITGNGSAPLFFSHSAIDIRKSASLLVLLFFLALLIAALMPATTLTRKTESGNPQTLPGVSREAQALKSQNDEAAQEASLLASLAKTADDESVRQDRALS